MTDPKPIDRSSLPPSRYLEDEVVIALEDRVAELEAELAKHPNIAVVAEVLVAWGEAIRGDWATIDGRGVRSCLHALAGLLAAPVPVTVPQAAAIAGVCPEGHWHDYCNDCARCLDCEADG